MKRLKFDRLQKFYLRPKFVEYDAEGVPVVSWGGAVEMYGEVFPATDRRSIESYGDRISGIQNVWVQGEYELVFEDKVTKVLLRDPNYLMSLGDGFCFEAGPTDEPDYEVRSFTPYGYIKLEIEKR